MRDKFTPRTPVSSHHPGPPRFVEVGEPIRDPIFVLDADETGVPLDPDVDWSTSDGLAPRLPDLRRDPDPYGAGAFEWSVASSPPASDGDVLSFATATTAVPRYDAGLDHVAEFEADAPGRYTLTLDAPDGTHALTVHAFSAPAGSARPRVELEGSFDAAAGRFHVASNAAPTPGGGCTASDLRVEFVADDRDHLATDAIQVGDGEVSATVPLEALGGERARVHAAAHDGRRASVPDVVELHPDGTVRLPNRPPAWLADAVVYQMFPRSYAGERGATTFETLVEGDPSTGARGVDYLKELGVDVVWLTPVCPAMSVGMEHPPGGPHGYDVLDYFGVAPDLAPDGVDPLDAYARFVDACHERGIRVVFDLVASHAGAGIDAFLDTVAASTGRVPLAGHDDRFRVLRWDADAPTFDWWDRAAVRRYDADGSLVEAAPRSTGFAGTQWMPNWNYDHVAMREYMLGVVDFWSRVVGVDGFRCDVAFGVQHGFWKEVREVVRANDGEFFLLDETVPNDPAYAASEFDAHFDTTGFTDAAHDLGRRLSDRRDAPAEGSGRGGPRPDALVDAVLERRAQGHPGFAPCLNAVENHDEHRLLNVAAVDPTAPDHDDVTDEEWERAAEIQRAAFAASVTLPGVPLVYYGAERQISRYGRGRNMGPDDDRGVDGDVDPAADVRPGGRQRAFMNWESHDEAHLAFYRRLVDRYHDLPVLHADAGLERLPAPTDVEAVQFFRVADGPVDDGPEAALVVVNFESEPVAVDLPPGVEPRNLAEPTEEGDAPQRVERVGVFPADGRPARPPVVRRTDP